MPFCEEQDVSIEQRRIIASLFHTFQNERLSADVFFQPVSCHHCPV